MKDTIIQYFENYPEADSCHETSDGFLFHKKADAESHGRTLEDKKVKSYKRSDVVYAELGFTLPTDSESENAEKEAKKLAQEEVEKLAKEEAEKKLAQKEADKLAKEEAKKALKVADTQEPKTEN